MIKKLDEIDAYYHSILKFMKSLKSFITYPLAREAPIAPLGTV